MIVNTFQTNDVLYQFYSQSTLSSKNSSLRVVVVDTTFQPRALEKPQGYIVQANL